MSETKYQRLAIQNTSYKFKLAYSKEDKRQNQGLGASLHLSYGCSLLCVKHVSNLFDGARNAR